uniref:Uncharacterized protein n=1 Tax=viral metagenome TaxID=1070528 RepID=A0A6C0AK41_9ZZZZ
MSIPAITEADNAKFRALGSATASPEEMQSAFETFQRASQTRDDDPDAFQAARFRYYGLKNGEQWMAQETKRINAEKMDPVLDKYRTQIKDLDAQSEVQKGYTDSIATIRDKQSSLKEGVSGNIDFLRDLLMDKEQKVSVYNRYVDLTSPSSATVAAISPANPLVAYFAGFPSSFLTALDVFLAVVILFVLILGISKSGPAYASWRVWFSSWVQPRPTVIPQIPVK